MPAAGDASDGVGVPGGSSGWTQAAVGEAAGLASWAAATAGFVGLAADLELLGRELADRLQHGVARLAAGPVRRVQQARLDQRSDAVEGRDADVAGRVRDRLGGAEGEATDEDREGAKEGLLRFVEQVVAPVDRVAHCPQPRRLVSRSVRQEG